MRPQRKRSWVRPVYLYLAALIGLVLVAIGGIRLVDLGLRSWIFTAADLEETRDFFQPPLPIALERVQRLPEATDELTAAERELVRQWLDDYRRWQERREGIDPVAARRQRTAASSLSLIIIGLPLYGYHWRLIRRGGRRRRPRS